MVLLIAVITVACWGLWLAPTQNVQMQHQGVKTFYISLAFLLLAIIVAFTQGVPTYTLTSFSLPFIGGFLWSISSLFAFIGTRNLGLAKAIGVWAPLNIVVSVFWGAVLFKELINLSGMLVVWFVIALILMIGGVLLIVFAKGFGTAEVQKRSILSGFMGAVGAGILWGSYFIPMKLSNSSAWVSSLPFALGMFATGVGMVLTARVSFRLEKKQDYVRVMGAGVLWGIGNYTMLLLTDAIGAGKGFSIAQLAVAVNALLGVYVLKDPAPKTRAAAYTLIGCILAMIGGIILGNMR